ncbi:hypothetical protein GCM10010448_44100 [Streptomyces glomeratus]|uniref:Insertion element IS402-like domain-containing protein n=1 Tax=Streptomyces glomeratus TaxID=284452 RepID=A0ABP6LV33_9ACTN
MIAAWKAAHRSVSGHQGRYEMREIVNALLHEGRTGCQWDRLPHDLPPRGAVMYYFTKARRSRRPSPNGAEPCAPGSVRTARTPPAPNSPSWKSHTAARSARRRRIPSSPSASAAPTLAC